MSGPWRVVGASVRGTRHVRDGLPCQDAHAWRVLEDGTLAFAVADGAGSAPLAEVGAATAVAAAISLLTRDGVAADPIAASERAMLHALHAVALEAARRGAEPGELATTLIVGVAGPAGGAAVQIGDGALVLGEADEVRAVTIPMGGEFANETVFLTSPGAVEGAQRAAWSGMPTRLAVFTDGLQALALQRPGHTPHAPFFRPLFGFAAAASADTAAAELEAFLSGPRVSDRADDDLTLLLAVQDA